MATATQMAASSTAPDILQGIEEQAILAAYQQTKRHGLEFGRLCYDYGQKHGAQGSANSGLAQFLRKSDINEGTAYYWIAKYKASVGEGIPCEHCTDTFPSKTQLKRHQHKAHPETFQPAPILIRRETVSPVTPEPELLVPGTIKSEPEPAGPEPGLMLPGSKRPEPELLVPGTKNPEQIAEPAQLEITEADARAIIADAINANKNGELVSDRTSPGNRNYHHLTFKRDGRFWRFSVEFSRGSKPRIYSVNRTKDGWLCEEAFPVIVTEYRTREEMAESGETVAAPAPTPEPAVVELKEGMLVRIGERIFQITHGIPKNENSIAKGEDIILSIELHCHE